MKDISIILPIHKWDEEYETMFKNAFSSVEQFYNDVKLLIVGPSSVVSKINIEQSNLEYKIIENIYNNHFVA